MPKINYKEAQISFTDQGKGTAIVLLHGFLENSTMWNAIKPHLLHKNRVITIDLLGHGKTECIGYLHSMELMANAVQAVLLHLKVYKYIFVGHSMGGYVALAFAEMYPDNIKGLVLLNSTTRADSIERKLLRNKAINAVQTNYKNLIRMSISNLFRAKNRTLFAKEIIKIKEEALKTPIQGYIAAQEGMKIRENREVLLSFSPYKKLMFIAEKDPILDYKDLIDQTENTTTQKIILPDGHMSHIENQQEVINGLLAFVKTVN